MINLKKLLIFLLCVGLLVPMATSCKPEDNSDDSQVSVDTSDTVSETGEIADPTVKAAIDKIYIGEVDRSGERLSVTNGKSYTTSIESGQSEAWLDSGSMLTDGVLIESKTNTSVWVGFVQGSGFDVIVNLGSQIDGMCEFETSHLLKKEWAVNLIPGCTVYVSDDGENYYLIGSMILKDIAKDNEYYSYTLSLQEGIQAKYIKYSFKGVGGWSFISEVAAFKYEGTAVNTELQTLYPDCRMPEKIETEELWSSSEEGYNTKQNMILGLQPNIFAPVQLEEEYIAINYNSSEDSGLLTNGKYAADNTFGDDEYFRMTRGVERTLVFDLTKTSSVSGYKFSFCYNSASAVNLPSTITIFISENGEDWHHIERITDISNKDNVKCTITGNLKSSYKARFAAITMTVHTHLYCDEIEIIGKKSLLGAISASSSEDGTVAVYPNKYASPDMLSGINDVFLMYNAREFTDLATEELNKGLITVDESLSYVAYRDSEGKILDYMVDSYLYLPFAAFDHTTAEGWQKYIDNTFTEGYNIDALNTAVGQANEALGNSDYKVKVFLSIFRPNLKYDDAGNLKVFGDIEGNGKNEDFTKLNDRIKCLKWMIDENLKRFNEGNYENLELAGFYWLEEQISYDDAHELDMLDYTVNYVHDMDYPLIWIPWYQAFGFYEWNVLGFDVACMQPNYFWRAYGNFIKENAFSTKALGMCVEFEVDSAALSSNIYRKNYKAYLKGGIDYGYMKDTIHMYYI